MAAEGSDTLNWEGISQSYKQTSFEEMDKPITKTHQTDLDKRNDWYLSLLIAEWKKHKINLRRLLKEYKLSGILNELQKGSSEENPSIHLVKTERDYFALKNVCESLELEQEPSHSGKLDAMLLHHMEDTDAALWTMVKMQSYGLKCICILVSHNPVLVGIAFFEKLWKKVGGKPFLIVSQDTFEVCIKETYVQWENLHKRQNIADPLVFLLVDISVKEFQECPESNRWIGLDVLDMNAASAWSDMLGYFPKEVFENTISEAMAILQGARSGKNDITKVYLAEKIQITDERSRIQSRSGAPHIAVHLKKGSNFDRSILTYSNGYDVCYYEPNDEGERANWSKIATKNPLSEDEIDELENIIDIHGENLMSEHSNLNIILSSPVKVVKGRIVKKKCIVLFCDKKQIVPFGEPLFPKELPDENGDSIPIDVREGYFTLLVKSIADSSYGGKWSRLGYLQNLQMGCSISTEGELTGSGTLGGFVKSKTEPYEVGFCTCAHVIVGENIPVNVVQPSGEDSLLFDGISAVCGEVRSKYLGKVTLHNNGHTTSYLDAAFVKIKNREVPSSLGLCCTYEELMDVGLPHDITFDFAIPGKVLADKYVYKCGRTTGLTKGRVQGKGSYARLPNGIHLRGLIQIQSHEQKPDYKKMPRMKTFDNVRKLWALRHIPMYFRKSIVKCIHKTVREKTIHTPSQKSGVNLKKSKPSSSFIKKINLVRLPDSLRKKNSKFIPGFLRKRIAKHIPEVVVSNAKEGKLRQTEMACKDRNVFAKPGDSGAFVFQHESENPVVIGIFTGEAGIGTGTFLVNPIQQCLDKLNVNLLTVDRVQDQMNSLQL